MASQVKVDLVAGDSGAIALLRDTRKEMDELRRKVADMRKDNKDMNREWINDTRELRRVLKDLQSPYDEIKGKIEEVHTLQAKGRLTQQQATDALKKYNQELFETSAVGKFWSENVTDIGRMAAGYLSVEGALELVNIQLERKRELEKEALDANLEAARSQTSFRSRIPAGEIESAENQIDRVMGSVKNASREKLEYAMPGFFAGESAQAGNALELAAQIQPHDKEAMRGLAEALFKLPTLTKNQDARYNAGLLLTMGKASSQQSVTEAAIPALTEMMNANQGDNVAEDAAIIEALQHATKDPAGRVLKGGVGELISKLKYMPGKTTAEKLGQLNPNWVDALKLNPEISGAVKQLVTPGSAANQEMLKLSKEFTSADYRKTAQDFLAAQAAEPVQKVAAGKETIDSASHERLRLNHGLANEGDAYDAWNNLTADKSWAVTRFNAYANPFYWGNSWNTQALMELQGPLAEAEKNFESSPTKENAQVLRALFAILDELRSIRTQVSQPATPPTQVGTHN